MLGTPPAFVLSQDQTLNKLYLKAEALKSFIKHLLSDKLNKLLKRTENLEKINFQENKKVLDKPEKMW